MKQILTLIAIFAVTLFASGETRYVGGDISLLPEYEKAGAKYYDHDGKPIASLLPWLREQGMNAMRVRLFVDPDAYTGSDKDANTCQTLDYIIPLCRRIKDAGYALMLDFHYSDTWADPAKQWTPARWANLDDNALCDSIYAYTAKTLSILKQNGATPDFIQTGNEISYGMLWGAKGTPEGQLKKTFMGSNANWERLGRLLRSAGKACREECPEAKIVIHTERVAKIDVQKNFYDEMKALNVDYDIIGISYYPYFHGKLPVLQRALESLSTNFPDKNIMIVETGYPYKWEVPGTSEPVDYPYTDAGQAVFAKELVKLLLSYEKVDGLFWWWMEYNAFSTDMSGWYNAPLFDSTTGRATAALKEICSFASGLGSVETIDAGQAQDADARWYRLDGTPATDTRTPGFYISSGGEKRLVRR